MWITERTAHKLLTKHGLDADDVRAAAEDVGLLPFRWSYHPERGWRAIVVTAVGDRTCMIVLYPAAGELGTVWRLGTAVEL